MTLVSKLVVFNGKKFSLSYRAPDSLVVVNQSNKLILKLFFNNVITNSKFYYNYSNIRNSFYVSMFNLLVNKLSTVNYDYYLNFGKLYMIGLGFKNFILNDRLYILVGDCNYIIFSIPHTLKVFCRRNQIYVLSTNQVDLFNFISAVKSVKKANFYKGKGVLEFKNFKFR